MSLARLILPTVGFFVGCPAVSLFRLTIIFYTVSAFLFISSVAPLAAQSNIKISGTVYDATDGHPLDMVNISLPGTGFRTITDQFGNYDLANIPEGDFCLKAERAGYFSDSLISIKIIPDFTTVVDFRLQRNPYDIGGTKITGTRDMPGVGDVTVLNSEEWEVIPGGDLTDVIGKVEGVNIQESGTGGGAVKISIRGCDPRHVLVLVNGHRWNDASDGEADLSAIPLEMVEKIEVYSGGASVRFGSGALGGAINIITKSSPGGFSGRFTSRLDWGKWKTNQCEITLADLGWNTRSNVNLFYSHEISNGDFDYNMTVSPQPDMGISYAGHRINNDYEKQNWYLAGQYDLGRRWDLNIAGQYYDNNSGLPGSVVDPDTGATKSDRRYIFHGDFTRRGKNNNWVEISSGFSRLKQYSRNLTDPYASGRFDYHYINDIFDIKTIIVFTPLVYNELTGGLSFERNILYHDDFYHPTGSMGRTVRDNSAIFISDRHIFGMAPIKIWDIAIIDGSLRFDKTITGHNDEPSAHHENWSTKAGLTLSRGINPRISLLTSYGRSFRLPENNALFWMVSAQAAGNPDLKAEKSEHSDIGLEVSTEGKFKLSAGMTYFHTYVKDIIIWYQSAPSGIWTPTNVNAALLTGHEEFVRLSLFDEVITFDYRNTITNPQLRSKDGNNGNFLPYRPHYVTRLEALINWHNFFGSYHIRLADLRYTTTSNTRWYDAYRLDDLTAGARFKLSVFETEIVYRVENLRGKNYNLISQYPMPGRSWYWGIAISYKL